MSRSLPEVPPTPPPRRLTSRRPRWGWPGGCSPKTRSERKETLLVGQAVQGRAPLLCSAKEGVRPVEPQELPLLPFLPTPAPPQYLRPAEGPVARGVAGPGQGALEGLAQVVEGPGNDHVVVEGDQRGDHQHADPDPCGGCGARRPAGPHGSPSPVGEAPQQGRGRFFAPHQQSTGC